MATRKVRTAPAKTEEARAESRVGKRFLGGYFSADVYRRVQLLRAEEGTTIQALAEEAFGDLLAKYRR